MAVAQYRAEVWQLPHVASWLTLGKKLPGLRYQTLALEIELSDIGYGRITAQGGSYLTNVINTNADYGAIIRIFDDAGVNVGTFFAENLDQDFENKGLATIHGPGIGNIIDKMIVDRFSEKVHDWIWDGDDRLDDGGFEDRQIQNEIYEVWLDAAVSSFSLTVDAETTATLDDEATVLQVETALQDLTVFTDVQVTAGDDNLGTEGNPWRIEYIVPALVDGVMTGTVVSGTGEVHIEAIQQGRDNLPVAQWTQSQYADARQDPFLHGTYASGQDGFRLDFATVRTGNASLRVNGLTQYAGAQQIVSVTPGEMFNLSVWVYTSDADAVFKFVLRDRYEQWLAQDGGPIAGANTWTEYTISDFVVPDGVTEIIFRIAVVSPGNPLPFYVDDASMKEGMAITTAGDIANILIDAAQARGAGDWFTTTWTTTLDSAGNAWAGALDEVSIRVPAGQTILQLMDSFVDMGAEWIFEWDEGTDSYVMHMWNFGGGGTDLSADLTFHPRDGWGATKYTESTPPYTVAYGEGDNDVWSSQADASMVAGYGRWEGSADMPGVALQTVVSVNNWLIKQLAQIETQRFALRVETKAAYRYGTDFKVGDTANFNFAGTPVGLKTDRIASCMISVDARNEAIVTHSIDFVKPLLVEEFGQTTSAPTSYIINKFLRKYRRKIKPIHHNPTPPAGIGKGHPSVMFSTPFSSAYSQAKADFIYAPGTGIDASFLQSILTLLGDTDGTAFFTEGTFDIGSYLLNLPAGVNLLGLHPNQTILDVDDIDVDFLTINGSVIDNIRIAEVGCGG